MGIIKIGKIAFPIPVSLENPPVITIINIMGTTTISEIKKKIIAEIFAVCRTPIFFTLVLVILFGF